MESKKINQLATELAPDLSDLTIIGDPTTGISKKITLSQMASLFTGTVEEYANLAAFPITGVADTIYIALDTNVIYRWDSTSYVVLSPNIIASLVFSDANGFDGTISLVGSVATLTITTALTSGSVPFIGASGALTQDNANLFFDDTNNRLGINTNAPTTALDVFGSGIIGRINATSTNNAYLGFSSAGTNKWSVGNVQSDHRFRIFSEANSAELVSVLQTGEFGIGIANPTTKLHIDGGASALIANLDANVSVAKSVSFRSDNSNRFNIEVSGTESGSNAGADLFIRRYSDAGSLIDTPLTITRSTGNATFSGILITPQVKAATSAGLSINANSGTQVADFGAGGSANITFFGGLSGTSASFSSTATATAFIPSGATIPTNGMYLSAANTLDFATNTTNRLSIASTGAATFSSSVQADFLVVGTTAATSGGLRLGTQVAIRARNVANTANIPLIESSAADKVSIDSGGAGTVLGGALSGTSATFSGDLAVDTNTLYVDSTNNRVGIGTLGSSGYLLDVFGTATFGASTTIGNKVHIGSGAVPSGAAGMGMWATGGNLLSIVGLGDTTIDARGSLLLINPNGGNVLIGTTSDNGLKLQVNGSVAAGDSVSLLGELYWGGISSSQKVRAYPTGSSGSATLNFSFWNGSAWVIQGTLTSAGVWNTTGGGTSDARTKDEIDYNFDNGIESILKLQPTKFKFKNAPEKQRRGFIAQDVLEVIPDLVLGDGKKENGTYGLDYDGILALAVKAIQEQQAQIEELKAKIK